MMNPNEVNNTGNQVNNNPVSGMSFVTGPVNKNTNTQSITPSVENNNQVGNMSFVNQPVQENIISQPVIQPEPVINPNTVSEPVNSINNPAPVISAPVTNIVEPTLNNPQVTQVEQNINQSVENNSNNQFQQPINQSMNMQQTVPNVSDVNNINTVQPVVGNVNQVSDSSFEEPSVKKKRNPIMIVLILILLTAIGVALGVFLFNKFGNKDNSESETTSVEEPVNVNLNSNTINGGDVDTNILNSVLSIVGIASSNNVRNNDLLNYYLSNNDYMDKINDIIVYSAVNSEGNTSSEINYPEDYDKMSDVGACTDAVNCALISKTDAELLLKRYNLETDLTKYFYKSSEIDDVYGIHYEEYNSSLFEGDNLGIIHNVNATVPNNTDISVSDIQTINYNENGNMQSINKNVTYIFKLGEDNNYYLDSVTVNE